MRVVLQVNHSGQEEDVEYSDGGEKRVDTKSFSRCRVRKSCSKVLEGVEILEGLVVQAKNARTE